MMVRPSCSEKYGTKVLWTQEHKEIQGSALDIDHETNQIAVAGKRWVALVSDENGKIVSKASRASKSRYDVTTLTWAPKNIQTTPTFALSSSDVIEIHSVDKDKITLQTSARHYRVHPRAISDIDWSKHKPNVIASCCSDDPICIWDSRELRKPNIQLQVLSGASQVKWSPILENIIATGHDCDVRIWDIRKSANPVQIMTCHLSQVRGLDWSPAEDVCFVTCGQDSTIKMWNFGNTKSSRPMTQALLPSPAWKIKYLVPGDFLVSFPVPQIGKSESMVSVWNTSDLCEPTNQLYANTDDALLDVCCGARDGDCDLMIYTLARDYFVRKWTVYTSNKMMSDSLALDDMGVTEVMVGGLEQTVVSDRQSLLSVETALNLDAEFEAVSGLNLDGISIEKVSVDERVVEVVAEFKPIFIKLCLGFPDNFEQNKRLIVNFGKETNLPMAARTHLKHCLQEICREKKEEISKSVLVSCITSLPKILQQLTASPEVERLSGSYDPTVNLPSPSIALFSPIMIASNDELVPFPRTCGARFGSSGFLVCFGRLEHINKEKKNMFAPLKGTPRSLRELHTSLNSTRSSYFTIKSNGVTIKDFYRNQTRKAVSLNFPTSSVPYKSEPSSETKFSDVLVYNSLALTPFNKQLAANYSLTGSSIAAICCQNRDAAAAANKPELVSLWSILLRICPPELKNFKPELETPWAMHPFSRRLINDLLSEAVKRRDIQTAAMIGCVLGGVPDSITRNQFPLRPPLLSPALGSTSPYNTISGGETTRRDRSVLTSGIYRERSASFDNQADKAMGNQSVVSMFANAIEQNFREEKFELLDPCVNVALEGAKQAYADIMYKWGMLVQSALVLKHSLVQPVTFLGPRYEVLCHECNSTSCICSASPRSKNNLMICSICQMLVKGLSAVCPSCGHGGHKSHMTQWFKANDSCPRACGCLCSTME